MFLWSKGPKQGPENDNTDYRVHEFPRALELMGLVVSDVRKRFLEASFSSPDAAIYAGLALSTDIIQDLKDRKRVNL